jgi:hypothetical protein
MKNIEDRRDQIISHITVFILFAIFVGFIILFYSCSNRLSIKNNEEMRACEAACGNDAVLFTTEHRCDCGGRQGIYYMKPLVK